MTVFVLILVSIILFKSIFKGVKSDLKTWNFDGSSSNVEAFLITFLTVLGLTIFGVCLIYGLK